jgi:hypothetical protein
MSEVGIEVGYELRKPRRRPLPLTPHPIITSRARNSHWRSFRVWRFINLSATCRPSDTRVPSFTLKQQHEFPHSEENIYIYIYTYTQRERRREGGGEEEEGGGELAPLFSTHANFSRFQLYKEPSVCKHQIKEARTHPIIINMNNLTFQTRLCRGSARGGSPPRRVQSRRQSAYLATEASVISTPYTME